MFVLISLIVINVVGLGSIILTLDKINRNIEKLIKK